MQWWGVRVHRNPPKPGLRWTLPFEETLTLGMSAYFLDTNDLFAVCLTFGLFLQSSSLLLNFSYNENFACTLLCTFY